MVAGPHRFSPWDDGTAAFPGKSAKICCKAPQPIPAISAEEFQPDVTVGNGRMTETPTTFYAGIGSNRSQLLCYADPPILLPNSR